MAKKEKVELAWQTIPAEMVPEDILAALNDAANQIKLGLEMQANAFDTLRKGLPAAPIGSEYAFNFRYRKLGVALAPAKAEKAKATVVKPQGTLADYVRTMRAEGRAN